MLTPAERSLLFRACWDHPVATCDQCGGSFKMHQLAADLFRGLSHLCPNCHRDLSHTAREHLISCGRAALLDAQHVVAEAKAIRESSAAIRKDAQQACDTVSAEAEAESQRRLKSEKSPQT